MPWAPATLITKTTSICLMALAFCFAARQSLGQAPEDVLPTPVLNETDDDSVAVDHNATGDCTCHQSSCARRSRWRDEILPYLQDYYWGYPENYAAEPLGTSVFAHFSTQVDNAAIARLFLYRYDFHEGQTGDPRRLSPYGQRRLRKLAGLMRRMPAPLRIEESGNAKLDEARRQDVLTQLAKLFSTEVTPDMVVIAGLPYPRLHGEEAILLHGNFLQQTQQGPSSRGAGNTSSAAFGGGSGGRAGGNGSNGNN